MIDHDRVFIIPEGTGSSKSIEFNERTNHVRPLIWTSPIENVRSVRVLHIRANICMLINLYTVYAFFFT